MALAQEAVQCVRRRRVRCSILRPAASLCLCDTLLACRADRPFLIRWRLCTVGIADDVRRTIRPLTDLTLTRTTARFGECRTHGTRPLVTCHTNVSVATKCSKYPITRAYKTVARVFFERLPVPSRIPRCSCRSTISSQWVFHLPTQAEVAERSKMPEFFLLVVVAFIIAAASAIVAVRRGDERLALRVSLTGMLLLGILAVMIVVY